MTADPHQPPVPRHSAAPGWDWRRAEVRFLTEAELKRFGRVEGPLHETLAALARLQTDVLAFPDHLAGLGVETAEGSTFWTASLLDADGDPTFEIRERVSGREMAARANREVEDGEPRERWSHDDHRRANHRVLDLTGGRLSSVNVSGPWDDLPLALDRIRDGGLLDATARADFEARGHLEPRRPDDPSRTVCAASSSPKRTCAGASRRRPARSRSWLRPRVLRPSVEPALHASWASSVSRAADPCASSRHPSCRPSCQRAPPSVRSFTFEPVDGKPLRASRCGQHVLVSALVDGEWLSRPYTLTSGPQETRTREVTVKLDEHGALTRWLFTAADEASDVRRQGRGDRGDRKSS
ncbi:MAG: hypothetical protein EXR76_03820 [Myxococcales bacterium]|nr:hypothetical protein [Myxococcales bacterium]